ncbi:MAG TPA: glycosyltransferase, partial [Caulobacteraceae bacterium]|nr:glycosyltransferase [Caulobacteraceae bacterium]
MSRIEAQNPSNDARGETAPRVSVIVPHYEDLRGLGLCLDALARQTFPRGDFEIIVSDNASPAGPEAVARTIAGRARLVVTTEKGAGPARNGGVAQARGEILAFTDSDCQPEPEWLEQGVQALSRCDFVGGQMRVLVDDPDAVTATEAFELVFAFDNETYVFQKGFTVTANLFCRREMFDRVGAFGVGLSEDVDWCHRATRAEFKIGYEPAAVVGHPARRTWAELEKKWRRTNREAYLLHSSSPQGFVKYV